MWGVGKAVLLGLFLGWQTLEDLRSKSIRIDGVLLFGSVGLFLGFVQNGMSWDTVEKLVLACIPGIGLLFLSKLWPGAIGEGDGLIFLVTGVYLGGTENGMLCYLAFGLAAVVGLGLSFWKNFWQKVKGNDQGYPFVPFVFSAFLILKIWGIRV